MSRSDQMYAALRECGGRVPNQAAWRGLYASCGYLRGAGYFGSSRPSMVRLADDSRVLTPEGWRRTSRPR